MVSLFKYLKVWYLAWFLICWRLLFSINARAAINNTNLRSYPCSILDYPFMVSVQHAMLDGGKYCAGTLISEFWVLTAKYCSGSCDNLAFLSVLAGSDVANIDYHNPNHEHLQTSRVEKCYLHPRPINIAEIALLKLRTPMHESDNVQFVKLPFGDSNFEETLEKKCAELVVTSWGYQKVEKEKPTRKSASNKDIDGYDDYDYFHDDAYNLNLHCADVNFIPTKKCREMIHPLFIYYSFMCSTQGTQKDCDGDSGGPLLCNGVQYGIKIYHSRCIENEYPNLYTKVWYFKDFIESVTAGKDYTCVDNKCKSSAAILKGLNRAKLLLCVFPSLLTAF